MNLINDPWIPIKRTDGSQELIAPWQLTERNNPIVSLDAPRPDFNASLIQFLIGLLQTTATPKDEDAWLDWLEQPPTPEQLKAQFVDYVPAFELQSFMQDFDELEGAGFSNIAELLIDSPGGNTLKENKDHFIKRGLVEALCPSCAITALYTLQTNAPSGGQGHRTSLRGGGPLTTLVVLDKQSDLPDGLWQKLWLNVLDSVSLRTLTGNNEKTQHSDIFPWLATTRTSEKTTGKDTTPLDAHPLQMYWGMPRRIRIDWDTKTIGCCDICGAQSDQLVSHYQSKNYGVNYTGAWQHPLSPYSKNKDGELLPRHAQPGGMTYQHWLSLVSSDENNHFNAKVVDRYRTALDDWDTNEQFLLQAMGFDMDNMKARCWYESTYPIFAIPNDLRMDFTARVQAMTYTAGEFTGFVRTCVKEAWFSRPGDAKGDTSFLTKSYYQHTEQAFYLTTKQMIEALSNNTDIALLQAWHKTLVSAAYQLFDHWAENGDISQVNPRRIVAARKKLAGFAYSNKVIEPLHIPKKQKQTKPKKEVV